MVPVRWALSGETGDLDLVSANLASDDLTILLQIAPDSCAVQAPIATGASPSAVTAADLDGDGDMDLVTANSFGDDLAVFFGRR